MIHDLGWFNFGESLIEVYELAQTRGISGTPAPDAPAALTALRSREASAQAAEATLALFAEMRALTPPILPPLHGDIDPVSGPALPGASAQQGWAAVKATVDAARANTPLPEPAAEALAGFQARAGQAAAAYQYLPGIAAVRGALLGASRLTGDAQNRAYDQIIANLPANARAIGAAPDVQHAVQRGLRRGEERDGTLRSLSYWTIVADTRIVAVANGAPILPILPIH